MSWLGHGPLCGAEATGADAILLRTVVAAVRQLISERDAAIRERDEAVRVALRAGAETNRLAEQYRAVVEAARDLLPFIDRWLAGGRVEALRAALAALDEASAPEVKP